MEGTGKLDFEFVLCICWMRYPLMARRDGGMSRSQVCRGRSSCAHVTWSMGARLERGGKGCAEAPMVSRCRIWWSARLFSALCWTTESQRDARLEKSCTRERRGRMPCKGERVKLTALLVTEWVLSCAIATCSSSTWFSESRLFAMDASSVYVCPGG